jgi:serine/threonine protein kinase
MDRQFTCARGHRWSRPADDPSPAACPVCGAGPVASSDSRRPVGEPGSTTRYTLVPGYQFLGQAGMGGMAIVFKARDLNRGRLVAIKILRVDDQADAGAARRFQREIQCLAGLDHPNIVKAYESGTIDGMPFFVMEYLEGGSLAGRLNGATLPPREAARLLETVARAVHFVHERGLIHRNLKPPDILFAADGTAKLIDFGVALSLDPGRGAPEAEGTVVGTPSYMAPEQATGRTAALGPATDVYGLGAVLYECLTGRPPFQGPTVLETLQRVRAWEPVPPCSLNREADREIEGVALRCLQKSPDERYGSALEVADDLCRYLDGKPVLGRRAGFWRRLFRPS